MRKINLRRILILILRTLAVMMLVFAFARPTLRSAGFLIPGKAPKNVVVCLDVSYSMGVNHETGTAFTIAKELAGDIVDQAGKTIPSTWCCSPTGPSHSWNREPATGT